MIISGSIQLTKAGIWLLIGISPFLQSFCPARSKCAQWGGVFIQDLGLSGND